MIALAYLMIGVGGIALGGAWSFHRQSKPWWSILALIGIAVLCIAVGYWRVRQG
ncbi:MAG: hypothetical protein Q4G40_03410 [Brachybacterium sp.]|nr:hypothetical protein [Brachybacterium sp.]